MVRDAIELYNAVSAGLNKLREIDEKTKNAATANVFADLHILMAGLKMEIVRLKEENLRVNAKLNQQTDTRSVVDRMVFRGELCWLENPSANESSGPYCPTCKMRRIVSLLTKIAGAFGGVMGQYNCPVCDQDFD